jgi:Thioredoxin-like domain
MNDFENENFEKLLEESSELINDLSSGNSEIASKIDIGDSDLSSSSWDHLYEIKDSKEDSKIRNEGNEVVKIVLYGVLGSTSFCQFHSLLSIRARAGSVRYAARHAYPNMITTSQVSTCTCVCLKLCYFLFFESIN